MTTTPRPASLRTRFGLAALLALAGVVGQPAAAAGRCPATAAESRSAAFDVEALFARGGTTLTPSGQVRLARFAQALDRSEVEVVVISVPQPEGSSAEAWRSMSRERAEAVREHLVQLGLAPQRVYTERRLESRPAAEPLAVAATPLVIEAVGSWQGSVAGLSGPSCVVQALPARPRARPVIA